ncbi:MAG TPA: aryl-sulfate sulfotransferase [Stellaceae bacterium]|nr:aryl-sulfate sulfotransferase [Stellaceae bacterium]
MTSVDQQKIRRARTGLIAHDPALAQPGYTLFAPMFGDGSVYLIDMAGEMAHRWMLPHPPGLYGYLLDNGNLFYTGKVMDDLDRFEAWRRFKAGAALEVDWHGRVLWQVRHHDHHHDARKLRNGNVLLLCLKALPPEIAARVQGGLPGSEATDGVIYADYLVEMTTAGETVWEWRSWDHLAPETHPITPQDHRAEWTHGNTVAETADGNILASFRNISTVVLIERPSGRILWELGSPPLAQQHDPRPLANGNVLIFDNGTHRRDNPATFSRVIEVDPRTNAIVWRYIDQSVFEFFSPYISGAQRLHNGNTLICEGCHGRIFEVTRAGAVVWEYVSPYFFDEPGALGLNNWVFRAFRYTEDEIAAARRE